VVVVDVTVVVLVLVEVTVLAGVVVVVVVVVVEVDASGALPFTVFSTVRAGAAPTSDEQPDPAADEQREDYGQRQQAIAHPALGP
jgi:hypothetical protein